MKSKLMVTLFLVAAVCGAALINGCGSSSSSGTTKFTIYGSGQ